ncbi:hypothetical protein ACF073_22840 [Streptomyces sp. NPDC015171]|uniref:hypothetical protein n=1 Tax=Streptomyces sp. NPDC015171 TaxID=3364945 RepID=UPI0036FEB955
MLIVPWAGLLDHPHLPRLPSLAVAPAPAPQARLLLARLDTARALSRQPGPAGTDAARATLTTLLSGLVRARSPVAAPPQPPRTAAMAYAGPSHFRRVRRTAYGK